MNLSIGLRCILLFYSAQNDDIYTVDLVGVHVEVKQNAVTQNNIMPPHNHSLASIELSCGIVLHFTACFNVHKSFAGLHNFPTYMELQCQA
jgi:hypothetical protein